MARWTLAVAIAAAAVATQAAPASAQDCSYPQLGCPTSDSVENAVYQNDLTVTLARLLPDVITYAASSETSGSAGEDLVAPYKKNCASRLYTQISTRAPENGYTVHWYESAYCEPGKIARMTGQGFLESGGDGHVVDYSPSYDSNGVTEAMHFEQYYTESKRYSLRMHLYANLYAPTGYKWDGAFPGCNGERTKVLNCSISGPNFK